MGASSSKAARQTATKARPSWAGATADSPEAAARARASVGGRASATKDDFIKRDSQDPHLLEQLNRIGPVSVHPQNMPFQTAQSARMANILRSRQANDEAAEVPQRNCLSVDALSDALNERKAARTQAELAKIGQDFNMDVQVLNRIARYFNAPTVEQVRNRQIKDQDDDGTMKLQATWTRAPIDSQQPSLKQT